MRRTAQYMVQEEFIRDVLEAAYVDGDELWSEFTVLAATENVPAPMAVLRYLKQHEKLPKRVARRVHA